ncbi:uncharacterized protein LOC132561098 [Ylistrum balloti]|uniref:uncharacterized protein LOC132561098 n=1 Tax=Ylistrum balloti TaxID=509963 RepID=UPI002905B15D|nr:uncharacterized protein LOC132561098 [Ylistrum balloti]
MAPNQQRRQSLLFDYNRHNLRILAFATTSNLRPSAAADTLCCDATFYTCLKMFKQLHKIHAMTNNQMYPLVFALLQGKSEVIYTRLLENLNSMIEEQQLLLNPTTVFLDFEFAAHNPAKAVFPGVTVKGCFFDFTRCIWRKTRQLGLRTYYRQDEDIYRLIRCTAVLRLFPQHHVEYYWFNALDDLKDVDLPVDTTAFINCVNTKWMEGVRPVWSHFDNDGPRTTNILEGWNSKLKKRIPHVHPNIFIFIRVMMEIQTTNDVT